jgi:DNA-binding LacI/PurR family transcriptional regulator
MPEKVTIATVARRAQVSRQTVSNVLNSPHLVRQETRERVRAAIDELGYRANQAARQMRTGRSRLIAVRIEPARDGINGWILDRFLHGLTEAAAPAGYRVMLYTAADDDQEMAVYQELLASFDLDAFVLTSTHRGDRRTDWLADRDVPFVTFGRPWGAPARHSWVDVDGAAGTAEATDRLLAAGHRRIGFIGWPPGSGVGDNRRDGWLDALRRAGHDPAGLDRAVIDGVAEGERAATDLLAAARPTALVCASDSLALGALRAAGDARGAGASQRPPAGDARGVGASQRPPAGDARGAGASQRPPAGGSGPDGRVAVIGFDDTPVARAVGLTSVGQPLAQAAARCVELLARLLEDVPGAPRPEHVLLRPHLVARDSG